MTLKRTFLAIMALAMVAVSGQAKGHRHYSHHNGKRYASLMKQDKSVSKFTNFSEHDETYPADALYSSIWVNDKVNPYHATLPDTFKIVVTGYEPPIESNITSEFGPRWGRLHAGVDIALKVKDTVRAAFDGQVRIGHKFNKDGYGWYVVIRHENGLETLYGHLTRSLVRDNQIVRAGQAIGLGGNTGRSTGPHLHFETRFLGIPMNPRNIIDFNNNVIFKDVYIVDKRKSFKEYNKTHGIYYGSTRKHRSRKHHNNMKKEVIEDSVIIKDPIDEFALVNNYKAEETTGLIAEVYTNNVDNADDEGIAKVSKPKAKEVKAMANTRRTIRHTVKPGDNLSVIARKYHTSVSRICELNHIKDREAVLSLGKKLVIEAK